MSPSWLLRKTPAKLLFESGPTDRKVAGKLSIESLKVPPFVASGEAYTGSVLLVSHSISSGSSDAANP